MKVSIFIKNTNDMIGVFDFYILWYYKNITSDSYLSRVWEEQLAQ